MSIVAQIRVNNAPASAEVPTERPTAAESLVARLSFGFGMPQAFFRKPETIFPKPATSITNLQNNHGFFTSGTIETHRAQATIAPAVTLVL